MSILKLSITVLFISVLAFDGLVTHSSIVYALSLPDSGSTIVLLIAVNGIALYSARELAGAGRHGYRILASSLLISFSAFIAIVLVGQLSLMDTKSAMIVVPVVLLVLLIIASIFKTMAITEWPKGQSQGFLIIGISILLSVLLLFASDLFNFPFRLSSGVYHTVVFIGAMLCVTIPLLIEHALLVSAIRRKKRPSVLFANAGLLAIYNLGLIIFFHI